MAQADGSRNWADALEVYSFLNEQFEQLPWRSLLCSRKAVASDAGVAQLVEHLICNQRVGGSNPSAGSRILQ